MERRTKGVMTLAVIPIFQLAIQSNSTNPTKAKKVQSLILVIN